MIIKFLIKLLIINENYHILSELNLFKVLIFSKINIHFLIGRL